MIKKLAAMALGLASVVALDVRAETISISADNGWHRFDVDDFVSNTGTLEWIGGTDPNSGDPLNFTFTLTQSALLTVVDAGFAGDRYQVFDNGSLLGTTSTVANSYPTSIGSNFDGALASGNYSYAFYLLGAGNHDLTGLMTQSALDDNGDPINASIGALRVAPVPLPAAGLLMLGGTGLLGLFARRRRAA